MATALLLIDVVNALDFEGSDRLLPHARRASRRIAALRERARAARVPSIYVNDNFDSWHLGFRELVDRVRAGGGPGQELVERLAPDFAHDYFVLKPMHSGFFHSALEVLLRRLEIHRLVLTGFAGDLCVLFTAVDAHMRDFELAVPADCVASETAADNRQALDQMRRRLGADVRPSRALDFGPRPRRRNPGARRPCSSPCR